MENFWRKYSILLFNNYSFILEVEQIPLEIYSKNELTFITSIYIDHYFIIHGNSNGIITLRYIIFLKNNKKKNFFLEKKILVKKFIMLIQ